MSDYPLHPFSECSDERTPGVLLLDADGECKTTAELIRADLWRIVDWEVHGFGDKPTWFARSWHTISAEHVATLAKATQP